MKSDQNSDFFSVSLSRTKAHPDEGTELNKDLIKTITRFGKKKQLEYGAMDR